MTCLETLQSEKRSTRQHEHFHKVHLTENAENFNIAQKNQSWHFFPCPLKKVWFCCDYMRHFKLVYAQFETEFVKLITFSQKIFVPIMADFEMD